MVVRSSEFRENSDKMIMIFLVVIIQILQSFQHDGIYSPGTLGIIVVLIILAWSAFFLKHSIAARSKIGEEAKTGDYIDDTSP